MSVEILINEAKVPAQNNLSWVVPVLDDGARREWIIDSFDLNLWFKEALGRYPKHESGDRDTLDDLKENWDKLKTRFLREVQREMQLGTTLSVEGVRISTRDWEWARELPISELPPLTEAQREAARKLKVPADEYARNFLAGERGRITLLGKAERLARLVSEYLNRIAPGATVEHVALTTTERRFHVDVRHDGTVIPVRIREEIVDDLFEGGSTDAEARLKRILEVALQAKATP